MRFWILLLSLSIARVITAQPVDEAYTEKIREYTTDARFTNWMVDHLPASETVPSPLDYFGSIIGAPGLLHETSEIYAYLRAVAEASPRVLVRSIGTTEEGREMIEVVISSEANLARLEANRIGLNRLADPRTLSPDEAADLIETTLPIYYITAGLHSTETGSPEMVMELTYRMAVQESEFIRSIRDRVIFIFTPVAEPDGRDRIVDIYKYRADNKEVGPGLTYWGKYAAHDNNRDGYGMSLALTRNLLGSFMHWKPQVMHDLHESVSYLYTSTGLGPYNEFLDPVTITEWHNLAHEEVTELTRLGMPGVWTHAFYNGWAANYLIWMANIRNSLGRFYETFGNSIPDTKKRKLTTRQTSQEWYRPNPPLEETMWSLRNNTNYMQSGVLTALKYTADNGKEFVENFYNRSRRAVERGKSEAPYAWVIPDDQARPIATFDLINLLRQQGLEIHRSTNDFIAYEGEAEEQIAMDTVRAGDFVIRMDQPYRTLAQVLLDKQNFPEGARPPYDDTGWTLPFLHRVEARKINDPGILEAGMEMLDSAVKREGGIEGGRGDYYILNNTTDDAVAVFRFRLPDVPMQAAETSFEVNGIPYEAGSFIFEAGTSALRNEIDATAEELGLSVQRVRELPDIPKHEVEVPRIGLVHTWVATPQDGGWWRLAFDRIGIPYTYLSEQDLAHNDLTDFDVIILPRAFASPQTLVAGNSQAGDPTPWMASDVYPHIGHIDQTEDTRKGMGYEGLMHLRDFIHRGGLFITEGSTAAFPIDFALTRNVSIRETRNLTVRGSVLKADKVDPQSPILYGYPDSFGVYFNQSPVLQVNENVGSYRDPDWIKDERWYKEVPRVVLEFGKEDLLMSGMIEGASELQGAPAIVDVPVGEGHVILYAMRPVRRWNTQGSHALVWNAVLHWNDLRVGWPERPEEE